MEERQRMKIPTRRGEISWLDTSGEVQNKSVVIPALPVFLEAMTAFAQGTLIQTSDGYVAIEDLEPGMTVVSADGGDETIQWIGSMTMMPNASDLNLPECCLYRVTEGGYGLDRAAPDLLLGPSARILPGLSPNMSGTCLKEISELVDGQSVVEIRPLSPVRAFHLGLASHRLIRANGVFAESYHPGANIRLHMSREMFQIFLGIFPHMASDGDFGPVVHKRLPNAA